MGDFGDSNKVIKELFNGAIHSIKSVVPLEHSYDDPTLVNNQLAVEYGVLIGFSGNIKGQLIIRANPSLFNSIGEAMYGMTLPEEMLDSFSGELGNMLAGSLSTHLASNNIQTDITHPTLIKGESTLSGFSKALLVNVNYKTLGQMNIGLLIN
ncbi:chemotaxis protein CheX [Aquibacillus kalidii]|uniref:chemotaxis protein CheX n=1 Tax=Aquibacillus kalidii TaxID=2762597 RepID=UPI001C99F4ED|nr:chemotaxis protein CheX [Aquibacillus kalidii]